MNDENESAAFCFRCPVKAPYTDPAILQPLYNPFPQLVRSDNLDYAHTQPLIHASYLPPPLLRPPGTTLLLKTRADFLNHFIRMHEVIHLQGLDRTPAKELARTALAFQYAYLHELMSKKPYQQTQNAWNEFNANEKTLRDIAKDILFVEELLATLIAHESIMYYQDHSDVYEVSDNLEGIS